MTWLLPAEVVSLEVRAPANAVSTASNWIINFMVVMITPVSFANIGYKTYSQLFEEAICCLFLDRFVVLTVMNHSHLCCIERGHGSHHLV
jgi:hypothetical protein